jgi:ABC-type sugar transport system substrate-binding protein
MTIVRCIIVLLLITLPSFTLAKPKVVWFSTLQQDLSDKSGFWKNVHDLIVAAAEDLDVDLEIRYAEENFIKMKAQVDETLSNPDHRPDGIIFHNYKLLGEKILAKAESVGVKSIIFNSGFGDTDSYLSPRKRYKHWIAQILPDDRYAGEVLLRQLKNAASVTDRNVPYYVVAMEGNRSSRAYLARKEGFERLLRVDNQLEFTQYIPADWSRSTARSQFGVIMKRYPETFIMWAANDNMALGLIDGAKDIGLVSGKDFVVGGVDWLPEALDAVKTGEMSVSIGGHFVEGMWALILMYDYLKGIDFEPKHGVSIKTRMLALDKAMLEELGNVSEKLNQENLRKVDFKLFSKKHNPNLSEYAFDIATLLSRL